MRPDDTTVQTMDKRNTMFGSMTYIRIYTSDYRKLAWSEIWATFADSFPGKWAVECFPPADKLIDEQNIYHLFVLDHPPVGMDISTKRRKEQE